MKAVANKFDYSEIAFKHQRLERLKRFTADDKILEAVDRVAFSQEDLEYLLDKGINEIYL